MHLLDYSKMELDYEKTIKICLSGGLIRKRRHIECCTSEIFFCL